jgi:DNA modification methylase
VICLSLFRKGDIEFSSMIDPIYSDSAVTLYNGDCLAMLGQMEAGSVQTCVTSPPYFGLRDYGCEGQIGQEDSPAEFTSALVEVFREVRRVLRDDGTLWLNLGDSYAADHKWGGGTGGKHAMGLHGAPIGRRRRTTGLKSKDLIGIPWRVAFALQADGWYLRSDIIWSKPNPMPESVTDRPTKAHEYIFLLSKSEQYYYDDTAIREESAPDQVAHNLRYAKASLAHAERAAMKMPGRPNSAGMHARPSTDGKRNKRSVWTVSTAPFPDAHFATFPPDLIKPCILAGAPVGGVVLDPFAGAGTSLMVAKNLGRLAVGIELNPDYCRIITRRLHQEVLAL